MKTNSALAFAAGAALLALGSSAARAQDASGCFPPVVGIPWDAGAPSVSSLDDLRWNGSFGYQWSNGTLADGAFRTLLGTDGAGNKTIYIYYKNLVHRSQINYGDGLQLGISYDQPVTGGGHQTVGQVVVFQFGADDQSGPHNNGTWLATDATDPNNPMPANPNTTGVAQLMQQVTNYDSAGHPTTLATVSAPGADPSWVKSHSYLWILPDPKDTGKIYYVAQLALPVKSVKDWTTAGIYIDPTLLVASPSTGVPFWGDELSFEIGATAVVPRPWPNKDYTAQGRLNGDPAQPPSPDHWGRLVAAPYPTCKGGGLQFAPSDILNNGGYLIDLYDAASGGGFQQGNNNFSVNIKNPDVTVDPKTVQATFNIAPFGSQTAHSLAWKPLNDAQNAFVCKTGNPGDFATCQPQAVAGNAIIANNKTAAVGASSFTLSGSAPWTPSWTYTCAVQGDNGTLYSQRADIGTLCTGPAPGVPGKGTWLPSASDAAAYNALFEHQCMMVQLSATSQSVQFDTQAQFMNMHVAAHASHFQQTARIDSSGLAPIKGAGGHWMYLVVDTRNMPHDIPNGIDSPYTDKYLQTLLYGDDCDGEICAYQQAQNRGIGTLDYVAQYFPTTIVHVYHDTGMYRTVHHKKVEVYEPQSSYGYYVSHDGKLYGWDVKLGGARKVRDNVWRVWVPNDKAVEVTTSVDALDQPRCDGGGDDDDSKRKK